MCGIAGYISPTNNLNSREMIRALNHRGPDHIGEFKDYLHNKHIFLGHSRLSILDLRECGNQPMSTPDDNTTIIYNGEVYNHEDLKQKYLKEYEFRSRTDTEVILYLYDKFGMDFIKELNGDFAFAIYDRRDSKLYLVRDRLGVKPLYYCFVNNMLIFGSEIKAIIASSLHFSLSDKNIRVYFIFKYVPGNETLFENIYRVKPGHYLEYDILNSKLEVKRYWQLKKRKEYEDILYSEAKEVLYDLLGDAVQKQLMSDVPVGTFLSGGLDSSAIIYFLKDNSYVSHYCARKAQNDIKKEGTSSDYYYAHKLSKEWKLNLSPIRIGSEILTSDHIKQSVYYSDDLIADGSQIASYLITKESGQTSKVMLSGMGGDELFYGYSGHLLTLLSLYMDKFPPNFSKILAQVMSKLWQGRGFFKSYRRYLHKLGKYYAYPDYKYGIFNIVGDFENSLSIFNSNLGISVEFIENYFSDSSDPFECVDRFEMDNFLVKNLHYLDRMCMANSVEGRVPYLDYRIVEFAFSINRNYKLSNFGRYKRILKDTFRYRLPSYIIDRKKAGFGLPLRSIFSTRANIDELLDKDFYSYFQGFSVESINRIIDNHLIGKEDNSSLIYALVSFQEWYKMFFG